MTGTASSPTTQPGNSVAVPGRGQQSAALAIRTGQAMWDERQLAALVSLGIPKTAPKADLAVFLHQAQRTGLDPFSRQIYLIYRRTRENGNWVEKPTTQVGIDGYRVIRDRIARRDGVAVEYEDTVWYDSGGQAYDVWLFTEPPAGCRVVVKVDGRRFPGVIRFDSYAQRNKDGELISQWRSQPDHMIEKCAEAFALRRAFPNDLAGLALDDEVPASEIVQPQPQRATAERFRAARQPVSAEVVGDDGTEDVPPAETAQASPPAPQRSAGGTPPWATQKHRSEAKRLGLDGGELETALALADGDVAALVGILAGYETRADVIAALAQRAQEATGGQ